MVHIDPVEGIVIAKRDKVLNFGGTSRNLLKRLLLPTIAFC
ncbi:MAG: hypothetical protein ACXADY_18745 [Candidatus Hodarchaeales archaeon]